MAKSRVSSLEKGQRDPSVLERATRNDWFQRTARPFSVVKVSAASIWSKYVWALYRRYMMDAAAPC